MAITKTKGVPSQHEEELCVEGATALKQAAQGGQELFLLNTFKHRPDTFLCHLPRAEPSGAGPGRAEPSRTQPRSPEPGRAEPNSAGFTRARRFSCSDWWVLASPWLLRQSAPRVRCQAAAGGRAGHGGAMAGRARGAHRPGRAALQRCGPGEPLQRRTHCAEPAGGRLSPAAAAATRAAGEGRPRGRRRGVPVASSLRAAAALRLPGAAPSARGNSGRTERTLSFPVLYSPEPVSSSGRVSSFLNP